MQIIGVECAFFMITPSQLKLSLKWVFLMRADAVAGDVSSRKALDNRMTLVYLTE